MNFYIKSVGCMEVILWYEFYFAYYLFIYLFVCLFIYFCLKSFLLYDFTLLIDMLCCIPEIVMKTVLCFLCVFLSCHTYTFRDFFNCYLSATLPTLGYYPGKAPWPTLGHHRGLCLFTN